MNQKIVLNKDSFIQHFLTPISRITDNTSLFFTEEELYTVSANGDGSVVLFASHDNTGFYEGKFKINLPDIKKFIRLLECIEEPKLNLTITSNSIKHSTSNIKFNYFLLEENFIQKCPVTPEKVKQLQFDTYFTLTTPKLNEVLKSSSIATDSDKVYLYTKDGKVYAELNDYERQNINNITLLVATEHKGNTTKTPIPLILENVRLLSGLKADSFNVKINNELKIVVFELKQENIHIQFILSALVK